MEKKIDFDFYFLKIFVKVADIFFDLFVVFNKENLYG